MAREDGGSEERGPVVVSMVAGGRKAEITEQQEAALRALARGLSNRRAATLAGVSEMSVRRWRKLPDFSGLLEEALSEGRERADRVLRSAEPRLVRSLVDISLGKKKASMPRVAALRDALTRLGVGKPERLEVSGSLEDQTDEELEAALLTRARERGWMPPEEGEE